MSRMQQQTIEQVAARAAVILTRWLGLDPLSKNDNGDRASRGGLAMVLGALAHSKSPPPPEDVTARILRYVEAQVAAKAKQDHGNGLWMTYDVDYGPGRELSALAQACEIASQWPNKSVLNITAYRGKVTVCDRQGYGAEGTTYHLVDDRGWLASPCSIDGRLLPLVIAAVDRAEVAQDVACVVPFDV